MEVPSFYPDHIKVDSLNLRLQDLCKPILSKDGKATISDDAFQEISDVLLDLRCEPEWSRRPRTYAVLRMMDAIKYMPSFINFGLNDNSFPYPNRRALPPGIQDSLDLSEAFLQKQEHVLSDACDLENEREGRHIAVKDGDKLFRWYKKLGRGQAGDVDMVESRMTAMIYARKRIKRHRDMKKEKKAFKAFENELSSLKRLHHEHLVKVHGSYTDDKYVALLMTPVADLNLKEYMHKGISNSSLPTFRSWYGCLADAVAYLKDESVRHRDIKPENILIKGSRIYITDFNTAWDWSDQTNSITKDTIEALTPRYASPEALANGSRRSSSDIWSLGVVFFEMTTVLRKWTLKQLEEHLLRSGTQQKHVSQNLAAASDWLVVLQDGYPREDNEPLGWIKDMIKKDPTARPSAQQLRDQVCEAANGKWCGRCCKGDESVTSHTSSEDCNERRDSVMGTEDDDLDATVVPSKNIREPEVPQVIDVLHPEEETTITIAPPKKLMEPLLPGETMSQRIMDKFLDSLDVPVPQVDLVNQPSSSSEHPAAGPIPIPGNRPDVSDEPAYGSSETKLVAPATTASRTKDFLQQLEATKPARSLTRARSFDNSYLQTEVLLTDFDDTPGFARRSSSNSLREEFEAEEAFDSVKQELKKFGSALNTPVTAATQATVEDEEESPEGGVPSQFRSDELIKKKSPSTIISGAKKTPAFGLNALKLALDIARGNHRPVKVEKVEKPDPSSLLTAGNLSALNEDDQTRHHPRTVNIERASVYMKKVFDDAESSVATSVMSTRTRERLNIPGVILQLQDNSAHLLENFTKMGKVGAVRELLEKGCNPGTKSRRREGPIFNCVRGATPRHLKCTRALIAKGVDLNVRNSRRRTPLHYAIEHENWTAYSQMIFLLLANGANPNVKDNIGDYPLLQLFPGGVEPLPSHKRSALALLLAPNYNTDVTVSNGSTKNTALHLAVMHKDQWAVAILLKTAVDVNVQNSAGLTPLQLAAGAWSHAISDDQMEIVDLLLESGASVNNRDEGSGKTLLHKAVALELREVVEVLLENGADRNTLDENGMSPLQLFEQQKSVHRACRKCEGIQRLFQEPKS